MNHTTNHNALPEPSGVQALRASVCPAGVSPSFPTNLCVLRVVAGTDRVDNTDRKWAAQLAVRLAGGPLVQIPFQLAQGLDARGVVEALADLRLPLGIGSVAGVAGGPNHTDLLLSAPSGRLFAGMQLDVPAPAEPPVADYVPVATGWIDQTQGA